MKFKFFFTLILIGVFALQINAQSIDYTNPKEYRIGGVTFSGSNSLDPNVLSLISGLRVGELVQVPGDKFSTAISNLWKQGLFQDVKVLSEKIDGNTIYITVKVVEQPYLLKYTLKGVRKSEAEELRDLLNLNKGKVLTNSVVEAAKQEIKDMLVAKGYLDVNVSTKLIKDEKRANSAILAFEVDKGQKVRIKEITLYGVNAFKQGKARRALKETKRRRWWNPFNSALLSQDDYIMDKKILISKYNTKGFRDAQIVSDSIYRISPKHLAIDITVKEGQTYYFRNINWVGNSKYSSTELSNRLGIKYGDVYDQMKLNTKLNMSPTGGDISSLYMDDGYLFFNVKPVETLASNDSIDLEMRIYEGKQATINRVTVEGNTKTNDHVILRELYTKPGQLFSRSDIIRSQRELSQLGYFDPEQMGVTPLPDPATGLVDIVYTVAEKPSDQIELSGGYGGGRLVGTLGLSFTNFSARNLFKKGAWRPLPSGDGQKLSLRAQSNGAAFQSYSISFTEPWLGGKKPQSLSLSAYYSIQTNGVDRNITVDGNRTVNPDRQSLNIFGMSVGFGQRLKVPDNYFTLSQELNYQYYTLDNFNTFFSFSNGNSNNIFYKVALQRNSIDKPIFETRGSKISLSGQFTPPYSVFNNVDYNNPTLTDVERYKFVEYQKYKLTAQFFTPITNKRGVEGKEARNLILKTSGGFGFLSPYNQKTGTVPFERFYLGGSGLTGFALGGREIIALRGYDDNGSVSPENGASYIAKYSMELRFPLSLNPQATIFMLGFVDAGNSWNTAKDFNPLALKKSTGFGVRIFLPMFGLLGFDYGWRLDDSIYQPLMQKGQFHFTIGASLGEL